MTDCEIANKRPSNMTDCEIANDYLFSGIGCCLKYKARKIISVGQELVKEKGRGAGLMRYN